MAKVANYGQTHYCTAKGALLMLAKDIVLDHAADNIRCNTLSPGGIATPSMIEMYGSLENAQMQWGTPKHPRGRLGQVEEIAAGAVFLASAVVPGGSSMSVPETGESRGLHTGRATMKLGIHSGLWMARWTDDIAPVFATVADLGFDGVEVSLLGMTDERATALRGLADDHGLEVTCSDGLSREADISSPDPEVRAAGMDYLRWAVRTTAAMGSHGLAGVVYAPWGVFDPANKAERSKRAADAFAALDADLERHDVTLGIEAINRFETDLVNTAAEAVALAADSGSARVGVLLDTFHMNIEEKDVVAAIVSARDHLVHFHVSDNDRGVPGSGHVPWAEVRRGLVDIGYDRWIMAEMFVLAGNPASADLNIWRDIEPDAHRAARQTLRFMRDTFG